MKPEDIGLRPAPPIVTYDSCLDDAIDSAASQIDPSKSKDELKKALVEFANSIVKRVWTIGIRRACQEARSPETMKPEDIGLHSEPPIVTYDSRLEDAIADVASKLTSGVTIDELKAPLLEFARAIVFQVWICGREPIPCGDQGR